MSNEEQISLFDVAPASSAGAPPMPPAEVDPELIPTSAKVPIPVGTYNSMEKMAEHCNRCHRCDLGEYRTNAVIGRGNLSAPIMLIGEGPGQTEDETGLPFTGKSGQLLEKILASVKLTTETDVFICNIVKCRPPENRVPTTEEARACSGYLREQIRLVDPKIILLTGATAMKNLVGIKQGITKVRGQWIEQDERFYMPIFHPAYLLRNPSREKGAPKWLMWQDIQAIKAKLDDLKSA
ncbi:uracil-DNA glycosylase [Myxacorys almedinensis]|uniref:Type-4 uracil-DNA glycosylase n=1 Tax=Myxacorys almedinensis A TaxID=2690445 RepID=A0A8J7Z3L2_9CYAN|nr:uracil-DNA glycosylase [Myxacorys almedinensis]NDJ15868.1 uracil-DNA glycosylase [Myxacorys almedinensis A]